MSEIKCEAFSSSSPATRRELANTTDLPVVPAIGRTFRRGQRVGMIAFPRKERTCSEERLLSMSGLARRGDGDAHPDADQLRSRRAKNGPDPPFVRTELQAVERICQSASAGVAAALALEIDHSGFFGDHGSCRGVEPRIPVCRLPPRPLCPPLARSDRDVRGPWCRLRSNSQKRALSWRPFDIGCYRRASSAVTGS